MFFFFKQKTAYEMRISDWSSDVCSSDLLRVRRLIPRASFCSGDLPNKLESQMRIYVDAAIHRWRGTLWCHMFSPNIDDLHQFAREIGMRREWFQDPRTSSKISWPHYDIIAQRRQVALSLGAIAVGRHQPIALSRDTTNPYFGDRKSTRLNSS